MNAVMRLSIPFMMNSCFESGAKVKNLNEKLMPK